MLKNEKTRRLHITTDSLNSIDVITNSVSLYNKSTIELIIKVYNNTQQNDKRKRIFGESNENDWNEND